MARGSSRKLLLAAGGRVEMPDPSPDAQSGQEHKSYDKQPHAIAMD